TTSEGRGKGTPYRNESISHETCPTNQGRIPGSAWTAVITSHQWMSEAQIATLSSELHLSRRRSVQHGSPRDLRMSERRRAGGDESRHGSVSQRRYAAAVRI